MNSDRRDILAGGAALVALGAPRARAAETVKVRIPQTRTAYEPDAVTIKVGDTVQWTNRSIIPHTVTCDPAKVKKPESVALPQGAKAFDSGELAQGVPWLHTFTVAGTYRYFCIEHETMPMVATLVVEA